MLFKITDAHESVREKVREFVEQEVKPIVFELDQENKFPVSKRQRIVNIGKT